MVSDKYINWCTQTRVDETCGLVQRLDDVIVDLEGDFEERVMTSSDLIALSKQCTSTCYSLGRVFYDRV